MEIYLRLDVEHVDGPRQKATEVAEAAVTAIEGETLEVLPHPYNRRSRYLVEDAEVILTDQLPVAARRES